MRELGYVEGKNLVMEGRFADGKSDRLSSLAAELVMLKVDVIVVAGSDAGRAAQRATTTIPIVLGTAADPIGAGLAASLARPGGNVTGLSLIATDLGPKHLEILVTAFPKLSRVAVLLNPNNSAHPALLQSVLAAAQKVNVTIVSVDARTPDDLEQGFATMNRERAGAVMVSIDIFLASQARNIAELAVKHQLPSIFGYREPVAAGGLMSYGHNLSEFYRYAATYVDKILKGAKPSELPIEQPTKFELVINRKTANALGITMPKDLLLRADEVIE